MRSRSGHKRGEINSFLSLFRPPTADATISTVRDSIECLISQWGSDHSLFEANQLYRRMDILDRLDAYFPADSGSTHSELHRRAAALCARLNTANAELYQSIRLEIQQGTCPAAFARLFSSNTSPRPGNSYDYLDELISGVLQFDEPTEAPIHTGPEIVFYQPTPARHIFALIAAAAISENDVLVDLGSGLGHVPLLVSICTGARCIGIEFEPAYVACARQCAEKLNLDRVSFLEQDARDADFSNGTVFYLYTPFTGSILQAVMNSLRQQAALRPIKICTFGPCTPAIAQECWLEATGPGKTSPGTETTTPETDQISVFLFRT